MKMNNIILLDLDGVLITDGSWKANDIHEDGYSDFNIKCVEKFNEFADKIGYDIVLSSDRRIAVDIDKMNEIFKARGMKKPIIAYVPEYNVEGAPWLNRRQEIEMFLEEFKPENYLILDDDKSLSGASEEIKKNWIQTYMSVGFKGVE